MRKAVAIESRIAPLLNDAAARLKGITAREAKTGKGPIHEAKSQLQETFEFASKGQKDADETLRKIETEILALQSIQIETQGNSAIDIKEANRDFARRLMTIDGLFSKLAVSDLDAVTQIVELETSEIAPKDEALTETQERENEQLKRVSESLKASVLGLAASPTRPKVPPQRVLSDQEALFTYAVPLIQFMAVPAACDLGIPLLAFLILWSLGRKSRPVEQAEQSAGQRGAIEVNESIRPHGKEVHDEASVSGPNHVRPIWAAINAGKARH